jgi:hypothetical protein
VIRESAESTARDHSVRRTVGRFLLRVLESKTFNRIGNIIDAILRS